MHPTINLLDSSITYIDYSRHKAFMKPLSHVYLKPSKTSKFNDLLNVGIVPWYSVKELINDLNKLRNPCEHIHYIYNEKMQTLSNGYDIEIASKNNDILYYY